MIPASKLKERVINKERNETVQLIDGQIALLWDRIAKSKGDNIKSAWTVAILELSEIKKHLLAKGIK
jgi:hypothetical protein